MAMGQFLEPTTGFWFEGGAIGNGETSVEHALVNDVMEKIKSIAVGILIIDIVADKFTAVIG